MGNNQSKTHNWKIFKVTGVSFTHDETADFIRILLHDYVTYKDGDYKHFHIKKSIFDIQNYAEGDYIKIDLNEVGNWGNCHDFGNGVHRKIYNKVVETKDSNGNIIFTLAEFLNDIHNHRERQYAIQLDAQASNYARLSQTSYDMPPKW